MVEPGETIEVHISKTQFWTGVCSVLVAVGVFGLTMRSDVTRLQEDVVRIRKDVDLNKAASDRANERWHEASVRLARIETMLEQTLKNTAERLTKLESWRDGPQVRPGSDR